MQQLFRPMAERKLTIRRHKAGFTLVELSIVLVIIGLIAGGVLVGRQLIRTSEIRRDISLLNEVETATITFKQKYNGLPGDLTNAYHFFGAKAGCTNQNVDINLNGCNGNGNGNIGLNWPGFREGFRGVQQLALAGMIPGKYSGVSGPMNPNMDVVVGTNSIPTGTPGGALSCDGPTPLSLIVGGMQVIMVTLSLWGRIIPRGLSTLNASILLSMRYRWIKK